MRATSTSGIDEESMIEAIDGCLADADKPMSKEDRAFAAKRIAQSAMNRLGEADLTQHIPLDVITLVEQGLMSTPLAPEYELHRLMCETCARNYEYAIKHAGDLESIKSADEGAWQTLGRNVGLYRDRLLAALPKSHRVVVVAGEIIEDVFNEEACDAIRGFAEDGNEFVMLAGPMIEKQEGADGGNHFFDLARNDETHRVKLFVADRRQNLHFAYSDTVGFIHLEAPHSSAVKTREYLFPDQMDSDAYRGSVYEHFMRERFDVAFASPDVRLCRHDDDVLFQDGDRLEETGRKAEESGLGLFGRFGLEALMALEDRENAIA